MAKPQAERDRRQRQQRQFAEQHPGDLDPAVAQHAQRGQFAGALAQRQPGGVVGHAEGDHGCKHGVDHRKHQDVLAHGALEALDGGLAQVACGDARPLIQPCQQFITALGFDLQVAAG